MKKPKTRTLSKVKKELDRVFSLFIRYRDKGVCVTCGNKKAPKYQQAGHYIPRNHLNLRWNPANVHCQCYACNVAKKGNYDAYAVFLEEEYGVGVLQDLAEQKKISRQFKVFELEQMIDEYKQLLAEIGVYL